MSVAETIIAQAQPAAVTEQPVEGAQAPTPEEDPVSPKLAIMAKKERALVQKQQEFQRQQMEWQKERDAMRAELEQERAKRSKWKENPDLALEELGWDYQRLTERQLSGGDVTPKDLEKKFEEKFKSFEQRMEEEKAALKKQAEEEQAKKAAQIVEDFKGELKNFVKQNADKYKLSNLFDQEAELLYDTIDAYYNTHNKILSNDEASDLVEKYFVKLYEDAQKALTPAEKRELEEEKKALGVVDKKPSSTTLTNNMQSTAPSMLPPKTEADRMKRAMAALEGNK